MCCEATDALLEFIRRSLNVTGLRNLNAPRRLKLRVPVLKEWLQRHGHGALASTIPDWDPVRKPTGRWKAWEIGYLKPIMDEKAAERQAKRNLLLGDANAAGDIMGGMIQQRTDAAVEGLCGLSNLANAANDPAASPPDDAMDDSEDEPSKAVPAGLAAGVVQVPVSSEARETFSSGEEDDVRANDARDVVVINEPVARALTLAHSMGELLGGLQPSNDAQAQALQAVQRTLTALTAELRMPALGAEWAIKPDAAAAAPAPAASPRALVKTLGPPEAEPQPDPDLEPPIPSSASSSGSSTGCGVEVEEHTGLSQLSATALDELHHEMPNSQESNVSTDAMRHGDVAFLMVGAPPPMGSSTSPNSQPSSQLSATGFAAVCM